MERIMITNMARRSDKRVDHPKLEAVVKSKGKSHKVEVLNICRVGLRFRSDKPYKKNVKLHFELRSSSVNSNLAIRIKGRIVNEYVSRVKEAHEYGVRFLPFLQWYEKNIIHNYVHSIDKKI